MPHTSLPVLALSVAAFSLASGQGLQSGVRVRLSAPSLGMRMYTGTLRGREARQLLVDTLTVPLHALTRLEVSQGRKSHTLLGAGIGLLIGGAIGAVVLMNGVDCLENLDKNQCAWIGAGIGGLGGAGTGALVGGLLFKTERWQEVRLDLLGVRNDSGAVPHLALGVSLAL